MYEGILVILLVTLVIVISIVAIAESSRRNEKKKKKEKEDKAKLSMTKEEARTYLKSMKKSTGAIDDGFMTKEALEDLVEYHKSTYSHKQKENVNPYYEYNGVRTGRLTVKPVNKSRTDTNRSIQRDKDRDYTVDDFFVRPTHGGYTDNSSSSSHNNTCSRNYEPDTSSSNHYHSNDSGSSSGGSSDSVFSCD